MPIRSKPTLLQVLKIILLFMSIAGIWYVIRDLLARKKMGRELPKFQAAFETAVATQKSLLAYERYFAFYDEQCYIESYQYLRAMITTDIKRLDLTNALFSLIDCFVRFFDDIVIIRTDYNTAFEKHEAEKYRYLFDKLEDYALSDEQIKAIVRDEDNNLVLAGAGTGKTTTIAGKVAYLLEKELAQPEELLVISFTKNAVAEMRERCGRFCKGKADVHLLEIRTFNSFGYYVKRHCSDKELHIAFRGEEKRAKAFLQESFDRLFMEDKEFQRKAINFISFFSRPERDEFNFETRNKYLQYEKSFRNKALDGTVVKSREELQLANFFCLNSLKYEYEKHYPLKPEDRSADSASYYPDFYLTDYDIWHEHYGIDREGNVPQSFSTKPGFATAKDYYEALMKWKKGIHVKYGTKLICTYSYENREGRLLSSLKKQLTDLGVLLSPRTPEEVLEIVKGSDDYAGFLNLVFTFLGLMKSNGKEPSTIGSMDKDKRLRVFMGVFEPLYRAYEARLQAASEIDFNDMINAAAEHFRQTDFAKQYKYILVDEFQDMSLGRYALVKSIRQRNPAVKLYAVGDDWQSIFRFTGSDISIITEFERHFGYTCQTAISETYRFNTEILQVSSDFIQRNPKQLRKSLKAQRRAEEESFVLVEGATAGISSILAEISALQADATVFLIGRYHHNEPKDLGELRSRFSGLHLAYHTAHKVKGMTCDYAVLLDLNAGTLGFPSELADDPLLGYLLEEVDDFENAEERRLFYVAITRARHRNYLMFDRSGPSKFVVELEGLLGKDKVGSVLCPECQGKMVLRKGSFKPFFGCVNYPKCNGKVALSALKTDGVI